MESDLRVDGHHLTDLTVRSGSTVQIDRLCVVERNIKRPNSCLSSLERNMTTVDNSRLCSLEWLAWGVFRALGHSMISITELELDHISGCCSNHVRNEGILSTADDNGDDSVDSAFEGWISLDYQVLEWFFG